MNILKTTAGSLLFLVLFHQAPAQKAPVTEPDYNKPRIFSQLPEKLSVDLTQLDKLFVSAEGADVSVPLSQDLTIEGKIVSRTPPEEQGGQSLIIRSNARPGVFYSFSKTPVGRETFRYSGRILSHTAGDAFTMSELNGKYFLEKKNYYELISE
jgi:hypothetical protein